MITILLWLLITPILFSLIKIIINTSIFFIIKNFLIHLLDQFHVYSLYKIPQYNHHLQENILYRKIFSYIKSLPSLEDSGFAALFSGDKQGDIIVSLDTNYGYVLDSFLQAKIIWIIKKYDNNNGNEIILKIRAKDKKRILVSYMQHIYKVVDDIEHKKKDLRVFLNRSSSDDGFNQRWRSFPFVHPSSFDSIVLDNDVKSKVKNDLELFLKSKQYYNKIGRVWRRSYLFYGGPGTGKSSFAAAMANFLSYDIYDIDLSKAYDVSDLKILLLQTTRKSLILVENLDLYLMGKENSVSLSTILNFMDGVVSSCGDERVMVFTMNCKYPIDPLVLRPGRVDVHIHFPFCDFNGFKALALSHLGVKEHKLFGQVEDLFQQNLSRVSPAEVGEIMISNRLSPNRAIKAIIKVLQGEVDGSKYSNGSGQELNVGRDPSPEKLDRSEIKIRREGLNAIREIQKMYGRLRLKNSRREESLDLSVNGA
ncbi:AAA-ATPase At2g46620-like [Amaranthus tricolor]|uniref:AAA-ATPase At2g46620-like n=1 Tax=Amaranthus tricolor TaxID=29722 RepID=UPI002584944D|nr:AAA-ATPase At2g46620-like [Amaranthus tricolor]